MAFPSTFADIQTAVQQKQRLDTTNDVQKVKDWINQVYTKAAVETEFFEAGTAASALAAGATNVAIPGSLVAIDYIVPAGADGTTWGPMEMVPFEELLELRAWSAGTAPLGVPSRYSFRSAAAASIEFWPNASGGEVLTFYGYQLPTPLSSAGDLPIFPEPYGTEVLEYGALCKAAEFKKDIFMLGQYQQLYADALGRLRAFTNTRAGDKTQQFKIERLRPYPRGNSVDTGYSQ